MSEIKNFCPKTGVGRFDAKLIANKLTISMKLHIVSALSTDEVRTWKSDFGKMIKAHWEGKFAFQKGTQMVTPEFEVSYVDKPRDAHFVLTILEGEGGFESVGRDTYWKLKDETGFLPTTAKLYSGSVVETDVSAGLTFAGLKSSFPFYVDMPGGVLTSQSRSQLILLATELKTVDPTIKVEVTAYGSNKSVKRDVVKRIMEFSGLTNVVSRTSKKPFWKESTNPNSGQKDYVKISLANGLGIVDCSSKPLFSYPAVAVHEFGHMLGLQDEYMCMSKGCSDKLAELQFIQPHEQGFYEDYHVKGGSAPSDRPGQGQVEFVIMCRAAGVQPPHFGMHTYSIMSSGSKFFPCHFVTVWAALEKITETHSGRYRIVPV